MKTNRNLPVLALLILCTLNSQPSTFAQGSLTPPPGPITPTMKNLDQIDPGVALDPAQFPATGYVITQPGSYYLTGNVTAIAASEAAITINASDVTLDLRGFALIAASGSGLTSADSAILIGTGQSHVTVRNGTITGAWYAGLYGISANCNAERLRVSRTNVYGIRLAANGAQIIDCHAEGSGVSGGTSGTISAAGISAASHALIKSCSATQCAGDGIATGSHSLMLDSAGHENGADGVQSSNGSVFSRCVSSRNTGRGFFGLNGCSLAQTSSSHNGTAGFSVGAGCSLSRSNASENGSSGFVVDEYAAVADCTARKNAGEGFISGTGSALRNCSAAQNGNDGFRLGRGNVVEHCAANSNGTNPANAAADGFELVSYTRVSDCTALENGGAGMRGASSTSFFHYLKSNTVLFNGGGDISLTNVTSVVIWNRVNSVTPAASSATGPYTGPFNDANTTKPFSNF